MRCQTKKGNSFGNFVRSIRVQGVMDSPAVHSRFPAYIPEVSPKSAEKSLFPLDCRITTGGQSGSVVSNRMDFPTDRLNAPVGGSWTSLALAAVDERVMRMRAIFAERGVITVTSSSKAGYFETLGVRMGA